LPKTVGLLAAHDLLNALPAEPSRTAYCVIGLPSFPRSQDGLPKPVTFLRYAKSSELYAAATERLL
jgi:hypothetical protein